MNIFDVVEISKLIKNSLRAGGEIRKAGILKTLKGTVLPNSRERIAIFINTIPANKVQGTGEADFKKWAMSKSLPYRVVDLAKELSFLSPDDMIRLARITADIINPLSRAYRISLALRIPNAQAFLMGQQISRRVQTLQYATAGALKDYALMKNLPSAYQEFPLPIVSKKERLGKIYAIIATIAFLLALIGIVF